MDRTEELTSIYKLLLTHSEPVVPRDNPNPISSIASLAISLQEQLSGNQILVDRLMKLTDRKEFSNDPTVDIAEISSICEQKMTLIQKSLDSFLKSVALEDEQKKGKWGAFLAPTQPQYKNHYTCIGKSLQKTLAEQFVVYQDAHKMHSNHVAQRNQRVEKYGSSVVADGNKGMSPGSRGGGYAMFSTPLSSGGVGVGAGNRLAAKYGGEAGKNSSKAGPPDFEGSKRQVGTKPPPTGGGAKVRGSTVECTGANTSPGPLTYPVIRSTMTRRNHTQAHTHSNTPGPGGPSLSSGITAPTSNYNTPTPQLQHQRYRKNATSEAAEQVEATLAKMGQSFSQLLTLVMEQSDSITRLEDDIEEGVTNTMEANEHINQVYEMAKGNRGMILKIAALLVFFIFVFLVWT